MAVDAYYRGKYGIGFAEPLRPSGGGCAPDLRQWRTDLLALAPPRAAAVAARRTRSGLEVCDRQIKYDPQTSRWFYVAIRCDGTTTENTSYAGFSKTSDATDLSTAVGRGWCGYAYSTGRVLEGYIIGTNSFKTLPQAFLTAHSSSRPRDRRRRLGVLSARRGVPRDDARPAGARALPPQRSLRRPCP